MSAGQKRGGLGQSERWLWEAANRRARDSEWRTVQSFWRSRDKKMYFSCFLCCLLPSVGNIPLFSPPLCSLLPCLTQWEDREPWSGKTGRLLSAAAHRPTVATAGRAGQPSWDLTYRPEWPSSIRHNSLEEARGYGMRGRGMWLWGSRWVTQDANTVKN